MESVLNLNDMLLTADARSLPLRDGCVQCVVTSPPYFGLRDYGHPAQLGLEATPDAYVAAIVAVFREVRRVLREDGTIWVNMGDSYATGTTAARNPTTITGPAVPASWAGRSQPERCGTPLGWKTKDLLGIPWMVAFALRSDGWYLRSDIIWSKPNPMPESVTDRPTKAHEYLFLLTKSERYTYDAAAIAERVSGAMLDQMEQGYDGLGLKDYEAAGVQNPSSVKARIIAGKRRAAWKGSSFDDGKTGEMKHTRGGKNEDTGDRRKVGFNARWDERERHDREIVPTRNKRTVWTIPTMPYAGAHFATMPEALVEPCILAGCPLGGLVLDPFLGSGTVGAVAERLGRRWVGTDLSYQDLATTRTAQRGLRFSTADEPLPAVDAVG